MWIQEYKPDFDNLKYILKEDIPGILVKYYKGIIFEKAADKIILNDVFPFGKTLFPLLKGDKVDHTMRFKIKQETKNEPTR